MFYEPKCAESALNPQRPRMMAESEECRRPVGVELVDMAGTVATRAEQLAGLAEMKLGPIMKRENGCEAPGNPVCEWPPFFAAVREQLFRLENALACIERCVRNIEI